MSGLPTPPDPRRTETSAPTAGTGQGIGTSPGASGKGQQTGKSAATSGTGDTSGTGQRTGKSAATSIAAAAVGVIFLAVLPLILPSTYYVGLIVLMLIFSIFAMSLNLLLGYGGLPSLGHAAFFGTAGYTVGFLSLKVANNLAINAAVGLAVAVGLAAIFGPLVLRTRGAYFLMITLAINQMLWGLAFQWKSVTGGEQGLPGITRPPLGPWDLSSVQAYYYFTLVVFLAAIFLIYLITASPFGRALKGIRESESRMESLGFNVWAYQYVAFILAAAFAGLAGILFVYYNRYVSPGDLHLVTSAKVVLMVILGGAGTFIGPMLGAFIIIFLENFISGYTERWILILGVIYVLVMVFAPTGIYGPLKERLRQWIRL